MNEEKNGDSKELTEVSAVDLRDMMTVGGGQRVRASFKPNTPEGALMLIQATLKEVEKLEDYRDKELNLVHWLSHPAQTIDAQSGEAKEFTRLVVWDDKGKAYSCGSQGVDKSIALMEMTRGRAPWNPPAKVTVKVRRLANKNNWMILDPDIESLQAVLGGKG